LPPDANHLIPVPNQRVLDSRTDPASRGAPQDNTVPAAHPVSAREKCERGPSGGHVL
jgi:hypothetical protein